MKLNNQRKMVNKKIINNKLFTRKAILARISVLLGGRMAERLMYGDVSTGAADDIEKVSNYIKLYNTNWGMSKEIGPLNPEYMGVIGENIASSVFSECKVMVEVIDEFTFSVLKKQKHQHQLSCFFLPQLIHQLHFDTFCFFHS